MKKLLPVALVLTVTCAQAQIAPPLSALPAAEVLKYQREHDSMQVVIAKRRKEIQAYNAEYNRTHPAKKTVPKLVKKHY